MFRKFGKLQRTAEMNSHGIGLGLTIVRQIIETHGGEIHASSDGVGKGSEFRFDMKIEFVQPTIIYESSRSDRQLLCEEDDDDSLMIVQHSK